MQMQQNIFEKQFGAQHSTLFLDRDAISQHYMPEKLPFREQQIGAMGSILSSALQNKKPDNLFIYGKVGTGKTVTTKHVLQQLDEFAVAKHAGALSVYINCRNHNSRYKVLIKILNRLCQNENYIGFSASFVYEKMLEFLSSNKAHLVVALDEIDKVRDLDDLVYSLSRANDELQHGGISIIGISNNLLFKDRLDARTRSSLCEQELVFPPYNAAELKAILQERAKIAFKQNAVTESALNLAAAYAAQESGDARTAVMLLLRAGELADAGKLAKITDLEVQRAKSKVEEEIIFNMIATLPEQQQLVLYAIACMSMERSSIRRITGLEADEAILFSGDVYTEYRRIARRFNSSIVSSRWYRQYIAELELYGLILTTASGKGIRGSTRLIRLSAAEPIKIREVLEAELLK